MPFRAMLWITMVAVLLPSTPRAQVPDHLKCYKIKDSAKKAIYTADLGGLAPEPGCQVKVPGKLLCVETTKTNVSPTPPGAPAGTAVGQFVCYKVKCPKGVLSGMTVTDQFGSRTVTPSAAQLLCAPAQVAPPTTTTTTNPASTTTTTNPAGSTTTSTSTTTTTTSTTLACGATGSPCSSNSDCCSGNCGNNHFCQNAPTTTTTTTSTTTTTTAPCPPGHLVGGSCWFIAANPLGESCDTFCATLGKTCDPATVTYAGTGGTSANCGAIVQQISSGGALYINDQTGCGTGAGCVIGYSFQAGQTVGERCTDVPTTCSAPAPLPSDGTAGDRICACM